ncbi:MAG: hypothetical protein KGH60_03300 [Candidatus Micrarchaeota archaeon]|nr:hypothetical protein [Candidatus Micrarchaeota archaeon]
MTNKTRNAALAAGASLIVGGAADAIGLNATPAPTTECFNAIAFQGAGVYVDSSYSMIETIGNVSMQYVTKDQATLNGVIVKVNGIFANNTAQFMIEQGNSGLTKLMSLGSHINAFGHDIWFQSISTSCANSLLNGLHLPEDIGTLTNLGYIAVAGGFALVTSAFSKQIVKGIKKFLRGEDAVERADRHGSPTGVWA